MGNTGFCAVFFRNWLFLIPNLIIRLNVNYCQVLHTFLFLLLSYLLSCTDTYIIMEQNIHKFGITSKNYLTSGQYKEAEKYLNTIENILENENISATTTGNIIIYKEI